MNGGLLGGSRMRKLLPASLLTILIGIASCSTAGPPMREYVLGAAPGSTAASVVQTSLPVVQIERVRLPDYLDNRDILTRSDGRVLASRTARWAERLSVGMTRALTTSLAVRLVGVVVTSAQPIEPPSRRVFVDVIAFETTVDRRVVLVARWTITDGTARRTLAAEQVTLTEPVGAEGGDDAIVEAMSLAVEELASRVAAGFDKAAFGQGPR